jgi:integrase/recombinase XerD
MIGFYITSAQGGVGMVLSLSEDLVVSDPSAKRWLDGITRASTKRYYKTALRIYVGFTGKTPSQLIDEALEDTGLDQRLRKDVVVKRLLTFYNWLKTEYQIRSRGSGKHVIVGKGVSDKVANTYVNVVRSFYDTFGVSVKLKGRHALPKGRVTNKRVKVSAEQVRILVDHARTPRDRAIILTLFQSGMDVSTLCSLKFKDISGGLARNELPLVLELYRPKTGVEYYTFLGKGATDALRAYIKDCEARGIKFLAETPLFLTEKEKSPLEPHNVQNMLREVATKAGFIAEQERNNPRFFNPLGPHALRESFGSIMINSGVSDSIVDFWLGHSIGEMDRAYKSVQFESLKKMYIERERLLDPYASMSNGELQKRIDKAVNDKTQDFQAISNVLLKKNLELEDQQKRQQEEIAKVKVLEVRIEEQKRILEAERGKFEEEKSALAGRLSLLEEAVADLKKLAG